MRFHFEQRAFLPYVLKKNLQVMQTLRSPRGPKSEGTLTTPEDTTRCRGLSCPASDVLLLDLPGTYEIQTGHTAQHERLWRAIRRKC